MANEVLDNRGRGEASWNWPAFHPESHKFAALAAILSTKIVLKDYVRFQLGEGIEKAETDFAAEVAAAAGLN